VPKEGAGRNKRLAPLPSGDKPAPCLIGIARQEARPDYKQMVKQPFRLFPLQQSVWGLQVRKQP
jgi:hypothetical protein